jgi:hypothetical protein
MFNRFGEMFSEEFEVEYLGFERIGSSSAPIEQESSINSMETVYIIGDKPHYYDGKRFLPILSGSNRSLI